MAAGAAQSLLNLMKSELGRTPSKGLRFSLKRVSILGPRCPRPSAARERHGAVQLHFGPLPFSAPP